MIKGKTSSGFDFAIPDGLKQDYRFIRAYSLIRSGDADKEVQGATELVASVFGNPAEEQRFLRHVEAINGRPTVDAVYKELGEIIQAATEDVDTKKS